MSDNERDILNLSADEKRAFSYLFNQADKDQLGVVTGENAVSFFERTHVSPNVLGEIWQIADTENRGFLSKPGFSMVLRLIGHYQAGKEPSSELAFKPGPIPRFDGLQIPGVGVGATGTGSAGGSAIPSPTTGTFPPNPLQPQLSGQAPIRVPPLDPQKVQQYSSLFDRSGTTNGQLDGATAKAIFERAGLPNDVLGRIWNLADRDQKGGLDQTEFIIAMHLLTSMKTRTMTALPATLPPGFYEAAARRGGPPSRQASGAGPVPPVPRQTTGGAIGAIPRTQSPLARSGGFGTPPPMSAQTTGTPWLITATDKVKFDQFFNTIDTQGRGVITGEQAVTFFSDSRLPEETLAQIWDLADINSEGQLNKDEFAVAMYLIRQQRGPNATALPAFLPPPLVPPSMRKQPQHPQQSTAPAFDNAAHTSNLPKSAADDLFGLDEPSRSTAPALQPQGTGASATRDPFSGGSPASPSSPARFQPQPTQPGNMFKPFQPTSAFGASLASQGTGGSVGSNQARSVVPQQPAPSAADDLLGDNETHAAESSKLTNETTELANMSNQIGNLRTQMEQTQAKKTTSQAELTATSNQKRDLELRLQQFRTQYEQEVRAVKEIEQQLSESKESTKKLGQELAMLEGTHQDLQTQHQTVSQALQADQQENASLKQRIAQINTEVASLKPEIEKLKMDARQQKGLVSINKKQLATNESDRDKLQAEKADLEREAAEREEQARAAPVPEPVASPPAASSIVSPGGTLHASNPFFKKASNEGARSSTPPTAAVGPNPSAFDALFGPSAAFAPTGQTSSRTGTPPATSFIGRTMPAVAVGAAAGVATAATAATAVGMSDSIQSVSSVGEPTPSATPPLPEQAKDSPHAAEPPPPPESRQFTASHLPVGRIDGKEEEASSTRVLPPGSTGGFETPRDTNSTAGGTSPQTKEHFLEDPKPDTAAKESIPGAFPSEAQPSTSVTPVPTLPVAPAPKDDFDSAFAGFGDEHQAKEAGKDHADPFGATTSHAAPAVAASEFPPIQSLEPDEESDSEDEVAKGFDDNFTPASPPRAPVAGSSAHPSSGLPQYASAVGTATALASAPPTYDQSNHPAHGGTGEKALDDQFDPKFGGLLPAREDPTNSPPPAEEAPTALATATEVRPDAGSSAFHTPTGSTSHATVSAQSAPAKNAFDDFDEFDDLAEAKEADKSDFDFGEHSTEFNPTFDSPAASMTNTMASSQTTPAAASRSITQNGFGSSSSAFGTGSVANSSIQHTPQNAQHDWDAIFSGLDNSKPLDTSLSSTNDPWGPSEQTTNGTISSSSAAAAAAFPHPPPSIPVSTKPDRGGAITPGTEHDDPILKRLTGMGYPRKEALDALEKYDYDINRAVDHLTSS